MKCKYCGSENTNVQLAGDKIKKGHSLLWWVTIGWWYKPMMYFFFTVPYFILVLLGKTTKGGKIKNKKYVVCNNCGKSYKL